MNMISGEDPTDAVEDLLFDREVTDSNRSDLFCVQELFNVCPSLIEVELVRRLNRPVFVPGGIVFLCRWLRVVF